MPTLRQEISRVRSSHHLLSGDNTISDRAIADELKAAIRLLLKREADKRRIFGSDGLYHVPCLRLEPVSLAECCDAPPGEQVARSTVALPPVLQCYYGNILEVFTVTGSKKLTEVTLARLINLRKLNLVRKDTIYYFLLNGYLYVTAPELQAVRLRAYFEDEPSDALLYPAACEVCGGTEAPCHSWLDRPLLYPGHLANPVLRLVSEQLLETYFRIPKDRSTDARDEQGPAQ